MAMNLRWFSRESPMRGRNFLSKSVLKIPFNGMAAWISAGVGKLGAGIAGLGVGTRE